MRQNFKFLVVLFTISLTIEGCNKAPYNELFKINLKANKTIKTNKHCLEIFEKAYGIDSLELEKYRYVGGLVNRFISDNQGQKQERLIYLRYSQQGEVYTSITFGVKINDKKATVTKYAYKDNKPAPVNKIYNDFDIEAFISFLHENGRGLERGRNDDLLIIDFKSNDSCECYLLGKSFDFDVNSLEDMSFFDQFSD